MADKLRDDIQQAKDRASGTLAGSGREIKNLESNLWEGETVHMIGSGTYGQGIGLMALTDRRLLFLKHGIMQQTSEDFPFDKISSIQWNAGMIQGTITVFVSGNKAEIKNVEKNVGKNLVDTIRHRISNKAQDAPAPAAPAQPAAAEDVISQLERLGKLRDAGVVTDAEFEAKKAEMLARL